MGNGYYYQVGAILSIEVFQVRSVLEVVGIDLTTFNHVVGLYVIGEFYDIQGDVFLSQDVFANCQDLSMRSGRSSYADFSTGQSGIIDGSIVTIVSIFYQSHYCTVIFFGDEVGYSLAFQSSLQSQNFGVLFVTFFNYQNITIRRSYTFQSQSFFSRIDACIDGVVGVDDGKVNIFQYVGQLSSFNLFKGDVLGIFSNVLDSSGDANAFFQFNVALSFQKKQRIL